MGSELFAKFVALGPGRTFAKLAKQCGMTISEVAGIAREEDWLGQCEKIDEQALKLVEQQAVQTVADVTIRHLQTGKALQEKAMEFLASFPMTRHTDALKALQLGVQMEREALRMDNDESTPDQKVAEIVVAKLLAIAPAAAGGDFAFQRDLELPPEPKLLETRGDQK